MRFRAVLVLTLTSVGLSSHPACHGLAWARPNLHFLPPAGVSPPSPRPAAPAKAPPGALTVPPPAGGSLYHRNSATTAASPLAGHCPDNCVGRQLPENARPRPQPGAAPWLLLGAAGAASLVGGGLLFWINRPKGKREVGPRAAVQVGRDGRPSAVIIGNF